MSAKCPTCKRAVLPKAQNPDFPFCSERCKALDLGKWLTEVYRVPVGPAEVEEDPTGPAPPDDEALS